MGIGYRCIFIALHMFGMSLLVTGLTLKRSGDWNVLYYIQREIRTHAALITTRSKVKLNFSAVYIDWYKDHCEEIFQPSCTYVYSDLLSDRHPDYDNNHTGLTFSQRGSTRDNKVCSIHSRFTTSHIYGCSA